MPQETELVGKWLLKDGKIVGDENETRIRDLVHDRFVRLAERGDGWIVLYQDPEDGSYREMSFPRSEMYGGGPAKLTRISSDGVKSHYPGIVATGG